MLIPSIDLMQGQAVQLIGGQELALEAGDAFRIADQWSKVGPLAVIDLDSALSKGTNQHIIEGLCSRYRCRVGGGIRDLDKARHWLNMGAEYIIIGTAATPQFVQQLPKERVMVALDAWEGEVVTKGWTHKTGLKLIEEIPKLAPYVNGFLITFVEKEGRLEGTNLSLVSSLIKLAGDAKVTIAGGISSVEEIRQLDELGADAQVGMALYTNKMGLADAFCAPLKSDREDQLWPTVVVDELDRALGLCYSNLESVEQALTQQKGIYWSRKRGLWVKGESSGHTQELIQIDIDCDRDTLRFKVKQVGDGFCHLSTKSCWGPLGGVPKLFDTLQERKQQAPIGSYTHRLWQEEGLLEAKILEEAQELCQASPQDPDEVLHEFADVLFFASVALSRANLSLSDVHRVLDQRAMKITRRAGNRKDRPSIKTNKSTSQSIEFNHHGDILKTYSFDKRPSHTKSALDEDVLYKAKKIVDQVKEQGVEGLQKAIADYEGRDVHASKLVISREHLHQAYERLSADTQALLQRVAQRIKHFSQAQKDCLLPLQTQIAGIQAGHNLSPVERVACYAPGGLFPLPSSVLMTAITAQVAGVEDVWVISPSQDDVVWGAAWLAGAKGLIHAGGAHAISAVAYGCGTVIPRCDLVVGPGNQWVTAGKFWVAKDIGIDMLAGPSELLVIADDSSSASMVAADLLAQAEHDPHALPILISKSADLIQMVNQELIQQLELLPTKDIARQACQNGYAIVCNDDDEILICANELSAEHLEVLTQDAKTLGQKIKHYGALFIGPYSAEVLGDYGIGPNHVLPTGRTARWTGGLSIFTFTRIRTWLHGVSRSKEFDAIVQDSQSLAQLEGLAAHAYSAQLRSSMPKE